MLSSWQAPFARAAKILLSALWRRCYKNRYQPAWELRSRRGSPAASQRLLWTGTGYRQTPSCLSGGELRENATAQSVQVQHHQRADPIPARWSPAAESSRGPHHPGCNGAAAAPGIIELVVVDSSGSGDNRQLRTRLYRSCYSCLCNVPAGFSQSRPSPARGRYGAIDRPSASGSGNRPVQSRAQGISLPAEQVAEPPGRQADCPLVRNNVRTRRPPELLPHEGG